MKPIATLLLFLTCLAAFAQHDDFLLQGKVVDENGKPIQDVYVVNLRNHERDISRANGQFALRVSPTDSLVFSHISYFRIARKVHTLLLDPQVVLQSENRNIGEVTVSPDQKTDMDHARENLEFLNDFEAPGFMKIDPTDNDPVSATVRENNRIMRSEAASISFLRFSPSAALGIFKKKHKRDPLLDYKSTRKVVAPPTEVEEEK